MSSLPVSDTWQRDNGPSKSVQVSVVIITYRTSKNDLENTLSTLTAEFEQLNVPFEVIVVNNGVGFDLDTLIHDYRVITRRLQCATNIGVTAGRNLGARSSQGELLVFLDDDAIPADDFVKAHWTVHRDHCIVACRGRVVPRSDHFVNRLQSHYDLGKNIMPRRLEIEGNMSVDADAFASVGGFSTELPGQAGHEGAILTKELIDAGASKDEIIYHPDPVIYHDYAQGYIDYIKKQRTMEDRWQEFVESDPELAEFINEYEWLRLNYEEFSWPKRLVAYFLKEVI